MTLRRRLLGALLACLGYAGAALAQNPNQQSVVSLAFVGDVMLDDTPGRVVRRGRDPFAPFAAVLASADIRIGNLECVVSTRGRADPQKPYSFRAHPRVLKFVRKHFDAMGLANNHSGDYGPAAFADMLGLLEAAGIAYFGGGRNLAAAHLPLILERKGLRIALLGYNEFFPRWFEADDVSPGIAWSEDEQVRYDITQARASGQADLVITLMHWGWEQEERANARQRKLARLMIEAGADAVVGGHPHVVQDVEIYRGRPIVYSLGNFVFDGFSEMKNNTGWLLRLEVDKRGVRALRTTVALIDREGIPHPGPPKGGLCWAAGDAIPAPCAASTMR